MRTNIIPPGHDEVDALRNHLSILSPTELKAIILRFWASYSIEDVATVLRKEWDETDRIIERGLDKLRKACFTDPTFLQKFQRIAA